MSRLKMFLRAGFGMGGPEGMSLEGPLMQGSMGWMREGEAGGVNLQVGNFRNMP